MARLTAITNNLVIRGWDDSIGSPSALALGQSVRGGLIVAQELEPEGSLVAPGGELGSHPLAHLAVPDTASGKVELVLLAAG